MHRLDVLVHAYHPGTLEVESEESGGSQGSLWLCCEFKPLAAGAPASKKEKEKTICLFWGVVKMCMWLLDRLWTGSKTAYRSKNQINTQDWWKQTPTAFLPDRNPPGACLSLGNLGSLTKVTLTGCCALCRVRLEPQVSSSQRTVWFDAKLQEGKSGTLQAGIGFVSSWPHFLVQPSLCYRLCLLTQNIFKAPSGQTLYGCQKTIPWPPQI